MTDRRKRRRNLDKVITVGIVGLGRIARDQHIPAIARSPDFRLLATADPGRARASVAHYDDIELLLAGDEAPAAIAICTPPQVRYDIASLALAHGTHVLLEKPPCVTAGEVEKLRDQAVHYGRTLFCAWHSRFAPAVSPAREWLSTRTLRSLRIEWCEDVRDWHPNQTWIWEDGGFGAFDPGINALSIVTEILARRIVLQESTLMIPRNCTAPAVAELRFTDAAAANIQARFDFLQLGPPTWTIEAETDEGERLVLSRGGSRLTIEGIDMPLGPNEEYPSLYAHFRQLIAAGAVDADAYPLEIVSEALAGGRRIETAPLDRSYGLVPPGPGHS
ncbi:MAG: Gfo/Idh/MocA family oxidoreductase [Gammaproteobacteria bacterium]|jgi:predicted dehydrogenase